MFACVWAGGRSEASAARSRTPFVTDRRYGSYLVLVIVSLI